MDNKSHNFFWPSYVDLMTALFAVVLVLFVLSFKLFSDRNQELEIEKNKVVIMADKYKKIQDIEKQIQAIDSTGKFKYDTLYKRFLIKELVGQEMFDPFKAVIRPEFRQPSIDAGICIWELIDRFSSEKNIRFMVIIEGNTANRFDGSIERDNEYGYKLSYDRALALYKLWIDNGIQFPEGTEIILSGSGFSGVGRDTIEENNKRFIIHIIPKMDKL